MVVRSDRKDAATRMCHSSSSSELTHLQHSPRTHDLKSGDEIFDGDFIEECGRALCFTPLDAVIDRLDKN